MVKFKNFEEIESWQKAREITREVYSLSNKGAFSKDMVLREQIRRSALSIMSIIAEGFERNKGKEFLKSLNSAKAFSGEVKAQLYVALDQGYISLEDFKYVGGMLYDQNELLTSLINYVRASETQEELESLGQTRLF